MPAATPAVWSAIPRQRRLPFPLERRGRRLGQLEGRRALLRGADQGQQGGRDRLTVPGRLEVGHQLAGPCEGLVVARERLPPLVLDADTQHQRPLARRLGVRQRVREQLGLLPLVEVLQLQRHPVQGGSGGVLVCRGGLRKVAPSLQPSGQQPADLVAVHVPDRLPRRGEVPLDVGRQGRLGGHRGARARLAGRRAAVRFASGHGRTTTDGDRPQEVVGRRGEVVRRRVDRVGQPAGDAVGAVARVERGGQLQRVVVQPVRERRHRLTVDLLGRHAGLDRGAQDHRPGRRQRHARPVQPHLRQPRDARQQQGYRPLDLPGADEEHEVADRVLRVVRPVLDQPPALEVRAFRLGEQPRAGIPVHRSREAGVGLLGAGPPTFDGREDAGEGAGHVAVLGHDPRVEVGVAGGAVGERAARAGPPRGGPALDGLAVRGVTGQEELELGRRLVRLALRAVSPLDVVEGPVHHVQRDARHRQRAFHRPLALPEDEPSLSGGERRVGAVQRAEQPRLDRELVRTTVAEGVGLRELVPGVDLQMLVAELVGEVDRVFQELGAIGAVGQLSGGLDGLRHLGLSRHGGSPSRAARR